MVKDVPNDELFLAEILVGVANVDSLTRADAYGVFDELLEDNDDALYYFDTVSEYPDYIRYKHDLRAMLTAGMDVHTTMFGIPVIISPSAEANPSNPEPPKPDDSGDREPRLPINPSMVGAVSLSET